ncbi:MAG: GGDEF domain-containing protein [Phycisphaeraceae bacterium]|nr:GGDEF domain-containing protein [Phycisphaeraceae bacterium]
MNAALLDRVLKSPRLPTLPAIAVEVIQLVQNDEVSVKQIAETISHDPALSGKILKTVNSSFYGQAYEISTISHALVILGLSSVKTLALSFSLVSNLQMSDHSGFDHMKYWKRSLYSAAGARELARRMNLPQQEEAFLGGLLSDLGMLALNQTLGQEYRDIVHEAAGDHMKLRQLEREKLETDHAEVGAALGQHWHLPQVLVEPIRHHEAPDAGPQPLVNAIRCVAMGHLAAEVFSGENKHKAVARFNRQAAKWFELTDLDTEPMLDQIHKATIELRRLFDLKIGDLQQPDEILARANDAMLQINLKQQHESTVLQQQNTKLEEMANSDPLTGVANRRRFNEFLQEHFQQTLERGKPLSLLVMDVDFFKKFNDTFGHAMGDRILVELAASLQKNAPGGCLVARYGGEEFAVVLPGVDRATATRWAEQTRRGIAESTLVQDEQGQPLKITLSIGVATAEGEALCCPERLFKAADQAVYAAKTSGRNCVRIFAPRAPAKSVPPVKGPASSA